MRRRRDLLPGPLRDAGLRAGGHQPQLPGLRILGRELPNAAYEAGPEGTPDAPTGIVVVNPDPAENAHITLLGPDERLAPLVRTVRIPVPQVVQAEPGANYRDQTIKSIVRDAGNRELGDALDSADAVELPPGATATLLLPGCSRTR